MRVNRPSPQFGAIYGVNNTILGKDNAIEQQGEMRLTSPQPGGIVYACDKALVFLTDFPKAQSALNYSIVVNLLEQLKERKLINAESYQFALKKIRTDVFAKDCDRSV